MKLPLPHAFEVKRRRRGPDQRPRKTRSDKGRKKRGGESNIHVVKRYRKTPIYQTRIRCPICGMVVWPSRFMREYDLKAMTQVRRGGGWVYEDLVDRPFMERLKPNLVRKLLTALQDVDLGLKLTREILEPLWKEEDEELQAAAVTGPVYELQDQDRSSEDLEDQDGAPNDSDYEEVDRR